MSLSSTSDTLITGYKYAGLRNGDECQCEYAVNTGKKLDDSKCNAPCVGDVGYYCGAGSAYAIYFTPGKSLHHIKPIIPTAFLQCFV